MRRSARVCALVAAIAAAQPCYAAARTDGESRRLDANFQSSFEAEAPQETQVTASSASATGQMMSPIGSMSLQQASQQIVSGMVESFLHREPLQGGELECLSQGTGTLAGQLATVVSSMVQVMEQVMGGKNGVASSSGSSDKAFSAQAVSSGPAPVGAGADDISAKVDSMFSNDPASAQQGAAWGGGGSTAGWSSAVPSAPQAGAPPPQAQTPAPTESPESEQGMNLFYGSRRLFEVGPEGDDGSSSGGMSPNMMLSAPALAMQFGFNMKEIMSLAHQMMQQCLHGDALAAMNKAAEHLESVEYMTGHFMANGQDVIQELSNAVLAWKQGDPKGFGTNFGLAARKVLLSNTGANSLPEGLPRKEVMANVSAGLIQGMFGAGAAMDLKIPGDVDHAPEDVHVDLHQCVNDNLQFFQSAWSEALFFFAKKNAKVIEDKQKMQWGTAVAFTMMQAPGALEKCGINQEQKEMLMDSIKALGSGEGGLDMDVTMPKSDPLDKDKAETEFAQAAKDWAGMNWYQFGNDLGHMLEQAGAAKMSQKYYIGPDGGLKKRLVQLADARARAPLASGSLLCLAALAAAMAMPLAGAAGLRLQRACRGSAYDRGQRLYLETEDVESGGESAAVE